MANPCKTMSTLDRALHKYLKSDQYETVTLRAELYWSERESENFFDLCRSPI